MNENTKPKRKPTHAIFQVTEGENPRWHRIGAGWPDRDGNGFTLVFNAYPTSGHISMRVIKEKTADKAGA